MLKVTEELCRAAIRVGKEYLSMGNKLNGKEIRAKISSKKSK